MTKKLYTASRFTAFLFGIVLLLNSSFSARGQFIVTYVGNGLSGNSGDNGPGTAAKIGIPSSLVTDASGNLYISDAYSHCVRRVNTSGVITTYAGKGLPGYGGDGGPATAAYLKGNWGLALDGAGNLFITDQDTSVIRRVSTTGTITRCAGIALPGYTGDGGPATNARLAHPRGIAIDGSGNTYFSMDVGMVRKISSSGTISHVAGFPISSTGAGAGYSGDGGPASVAQLDALFGMACDAAGNLFICDGLNNVIRKINTAGIITTIAGNGTAGYGGDGGQATAAKLNHPTGICLSNSGEIYIADLSNHRVRKVNAAGVITTIAGTGVPGYGGDNSPATAAQLNSPISVAIDANDNIYIGEENGHRVRKIVKSLAFTKGPMQNLSLCMNSGVKSINTLLTVQDFSIGLMDTWSVFAAPSNGTVTVTYSTTSTGGVLTPTGIYYTPATGFSGSDNFKVKVSNSSASDIISINVTVAPMTLSAGTITGDSSVCLGAAITLSSTVAGGMWSSTNNSALETPITGGKLVVTGNKAPGLDTIWYTVSNACGTASEMWPLTIRPLPTPGIISGPAGVCVGSSITLNASMPGGTWGSNNATVTLVPMGDNSIISGVAPGTVVIRYMVMNTWCPAITSHILNVETFPQADAITGPLSVCVGTETTLRNVMPGGTWTSSDISIATATNFNTLLIGQGLVKGVSAGVAIISYEVTNSCGTDIVDKAVTVHPLPDAPQITRNDGVLSVPADYAGYQWMKDGWNIDGAVHDTCAIEAKGQYAVVVSNIEGCSRLSAPFPFSGCDPLELDVFPNPTFSKIYVTWCRKVDARITASDGRTMGELFNVNEIDMDYLPPGAYIVSFYDLSGKKVKSQKVEKLP